MTASLDIADPPCTAGPVESLRSALDAVLRPLVPVDRPVALLDFPVHDNVGDCMIWLGSRATLQRLGAPPLSYTCCIQSFSREDLARRIGNGTIFLSGGGNFGDVYPPHQDLREAVIAAFPDNPIVQLPQSIFFESAAATERARRVLEAHPQLTLLVRDHRSLAIAQRDFPGVRSILCTDMAFGLGPLPPGRPPSERIVWLSRTDRESSWGGALEPPACVERVDWVAPPRDRRGPSVQRRIWRRVIREPGLVRLLDPGIARWHLRRGVQMLSGARCVITDRLHGHILALMLGIPHCLLPNTNGKIQAFHETWTHGSPLVSWCESEAEALRIALATPGHAGGA
jgi:pyruvyl transferase EpsO